MIDSTSKVTISFKKGHEMLLSEAMRFPSAGLPWYESSTERFQAETVRVTMDTTIEVVVTQKLGK
jgi:hypothetical protein